jgi:glutathione S-transferase
VKLYSNKFAPSPRRVRMYAAEKGLPLEVVEIDIAAGEHRGAGYLAVNPLAELPTRNRTCSAARPASGPRSIAGLTG